jgi:serine/threonine-protein kinase RsbW
MRDTGHNRAADVVIPSDPAEARRVQDEIERYLREHEFDDREIFSIRLALEEALVNAIKHGNQLDHSKKVHIAYSVTSDRFDISITDEGPGFDPEDVPDPMATENLERPCGRGLLLMRHYMTEVTFHPPGNRMTMCRVRNLNNSVHRNGKK